MPVLSDLTGLAVVALAALVCGIVMTRLRQPAVVGYILAGILLGPSVLGLVESRDQVASLAELGVLMLLFVVGMELSLRGFKGVWRLAILATVLQIATALAVMLILARLFDWTVGLAVLLAFVVALSSTAIVIKMLEQIDILRSPPGRTIVAILIVQDLAIAPMMLTLGTLAAARPDMLDVALIVASVAFLAALTIYLSRRRRIVLPFTRIVAGQMDLRPLAGLSWCFGLAAVTGLLGLSPAYGAFLAGLVIGNSTARAAMIRSMRPVQSVLIMVFFLSVGLLMDLAFIWRNLLTVLLLLAFVTGLKTAFNIGILRLLGEPWPRAFLAGAILAQIGEFSFVLGQTGAAAGLVGADTSRLIVAVTAASLLISPLWLGAARRLLGVAPLGGGGWRENLDAVGGDWAPRAGRVARGIMARTGSGMARAGRLAIPRPRRLAPEDAGEPADPPAKQKRNDPKRDDPKRDDNA